MATSKKPTAKQLAARKKFAEAAKSGKFRKKKTAVKKRAPAKKTTKRAMPKSKAAPRYKMTWQWTPKGKKVGNIPISGVKEFKVWEKYLKAKGAINIKYVKL